MERPDKDDWGMLGTFLKESIVTQEQAHLVETAIPLEPAARILPERSNFSVWGLKKGVSPSLHQYDKRRPSATLLEISK